MRRKYSEVEKREVVRKIEEKCSQGLSLKEACTEVGVVETTYYKWKRNKNEQPYVESIQLELEKVRNENVLLRRKLGELLIEREMKY